MPYRHYKKNYLTAVIFQLRFPCILKLEGGSPAEFQERVKSRFPIYRPGTEISLDLLMRGDGAQTEKKTTRPRWLFFSKDDTKSVTLSADLLSLEYRRFNDVSESEDDFRFVWTALRDLYEITRIDRLGVRYIDEIAFPSGNPFDWDGYFNSEIISTTKAMTAQLEDHQVLRAMHVLHLGGTDHRITFQFGLNNEDFPNPIAKRRFVLDYDCSSLGLIEPADVESTIRRFNEVIHDFFEKSIEEELRTEMGTIDEVEK